MARDYGRRQTSRKSSGGSSQILVVVLSFLIGYLTASVMDIGKLGLWLNKEVLAHKETEPQKPQHQPAQGQQPQAQAQAQIPKPKFEFYTLLTKEQRAAGPVTRTAQETASASAQNTGTQVQKTVNKETTKVASTKPATTPTQAKNSAAAAVKVVEAKPVPKKESYLIQVASFKTRQDAERVKAGLILKGYEVSVTAVNQPNKGTWFRVLLGPYNNKPAATKTLASLAQSQHVRGFIIRG